MVKLKKIVAIQDSGLIIDRLTWESQVYGGVIMGLNYGLFEERVVDPTTGTMLNPDMEMYKLAGAADIPEIIVRAYEPDEIKGRGVDRLWASLQRFPRPRPSAMRSPMPSVCGCPSGR